MAGEPFRASFPEAGAVGLPAVAAELRVVLGAGALPATEPPAYARQLGERARAERVSFRDAWIEAAFQPGNARLSAAMR